MDQRYGAWAQLLTLFRMIYDGGRHAGLRIPARRGYLFDPDRYNFLEGRSWKTARRLEEKVDVPRVADGVIHRVLEKLLILDGERLSYRTLDVEQIGSVYETMMGFNLQVAEGRSIAIKPTKSHGAPTALNLDALLVTKPADRAKWIAEKSDQKLTGQAAEAIKGADSLEDLLAGLDRKVARHATPNVVPKGAMVLQPSDERRRSGSHYTPRSLTEPIVRTTLKPILDQIGEHPKPEQILALKVCDPAMGSGAFLVEACRQLGDVLVEAWHFHDCLPAFPPDEDELLHARRLIAQRCLYGVDKNPMAVDLSKLSLWLATLAKDHPFTFLDHSLRAGDSLVGLTREQIIHFNWAPNEAETLPKKKKTSRSSQAASDQPLATLFSDPLADRMRTVTEYRQRILAARDDKPYEQLRQELDMADEALSLARLAGDCVIAAFFSSDKDRERLDKLATLSRQMVQYLSPQGKIEDRQPLTEAVSSLHGGPHPIHPFHWEIEFPEVFTGDGMDKSRSGFDAIVGNPPFLGGKRIAGALSKNYSYWLGFLNCETNGNADLVAHFFRQSFRLLRDLGTFGLIATNTISQGDTRRAGLRWIGNNDGQIYSARRRYAWPGIAAVIVSVVWVIRGKYPRNMMLDGNAVEYISAFLFHRGSHSDPYRLDANASKSFIGCDIKGQGFLFDDSDPAASPIALMNKVLTQEPINAQRILPYVGGEEINERPVQHHDRWVISFEEMDASEASKWPCLLRILEQKVKPERLTKSADLAAWPWWQFWRVRRELADASSHLPEVLAVSQTGNALAFAFLERPVVLSHTVVVFPTIARGFFCVLQSRVHYFWARLFSATMKDDARYIPNDCFETFPFPPGVLEHASSLIASIDNSSLSALETAGREYYEFRAALMVRNNEGLTKTYNRFHDPHETSPDILRLRELHAAMDRAVLEAYGWHDLAQTATCEFLLDYEDDEDDEQDEPSSGRRRKKPWRYRWPDDFRDEVLARLLALNAKRHEEEVAAGKAAEANSDATKAKPKRQPNPRKKPASDQPDAPASQRELF
jgi:hypothetical protein